MHVVVPRDKMSEDGTHPTDQRYSLMAHWWYEAARNATSELFTSKVETVEDGSQKTKDSAATTMMSSLLPMLAAVLANFALLR